MNNKQFKNQLVMSLYKDITKIHRLQSNLISKILAQDLTKKYAEDYHLARGKRLAYDRIENILLQMLE